MKTLLALLLLIPSLGWGNVPNCQTPVEYIECEEDKCSWKTDTKEHFNNLFEEYKNYVFKFIDEAKKDERNFTDD